jgi:hypothetical protein
LCAVNHWIFLELRPPSFCSLGIKSAVPNLSDKAKSMSASYLHYLSSLIFY